MKIRTLGPTEQISEPGFYAMPLSRHHDQPCVGISVTSGILRAMELGTPADVWAFHKLNPERWERKETEALRLGIAMALYVEGGPYKVLEGFKIHPEEKLRRPFPSQIRAYDQGRASDTAIQSVEYWRAVDADPHDYLDQSDFDNVCMMGAVLERDPVAKAVMSGIPEVTMAWQDEITGLWVLSRPDTLNFDGVVTDYKRIAAGGGHFTTRLVDRRIEEHGYDMQIALGGEGMERLAGGMPHASGIIAQCAEAPYHIILRSMDDEVLSIARWRNRRGLDRFHECLTSNHWPGPGDVVGAYQMRKELRESLLEQMNTANAAP